MLSVTLSGNSSESFRTSPVIWDYTVLATWQSECALT